MSETRSIWTEQYRVPTFSSSVVLLLLVSFSLFSFSQGYSMSFDDTPSSTEQVMNAIGDVQMWGAGLMGGSLFLIFTLILRLKVFVWAAYVYMTGLHLCFSIMVGQAPGGDWKDVATFAAGFLWYGVFVYLSMPFGNGRERV